MKLAVIFGFVGAALAGTELHLFVSGDGQYDRVNFVGGDVITAGNGTAAPLVLNSDGSLVNTESLKYIGVNDEGKYIETDELDLEFGYNNSHLEYQGSRFVYVDAEHQIGPKEGGQRLYLPVHHTKSVADVFPEEYSEPNEYWYRLTTLAPGTDFHYRWISKKTNDSVYYVNSFLGEYVSFTVKDDADVVLDHTGAPVYVDPKTGQVTAGTEHTSGFSVEDDLVLLNGENSWYACPLGPRLFVLSTDCAGGVKIDLVAYNKRYV